MVGAGVGEGEEIFNEGGGGCGRPPLAGGLEGPCVCSTGFGGGGSREGRRGQQIHLSEGGSGAHSRGARGHKPEKDPESPFHYICL